MSLFKSSDLHDTATELSVNKSSGTHYIASQCFISDERQSTIRESVGALERGLSCCYVTDGAWSNIELLEHLLSITGPANLYLTTFAISAEALTRIAAWQSSLQIIETWAVLDDGLRKRKPAEYQQATGVFNNLRVCKCHAKVMVIANNNYQVAVCGSANFTKNHRKESGVIIFDQSVAENYILWIMEEFKND